MKRQDRHQERRPAPLPRSNALRTLVIAARTVSFLAAAAWWVLLHVGVPVLDRLRAFRWELYPVLALCVGLYSVGTYLGGLPLGLLAVAYVLAAAPGVVLAALCWNPGALRAHRAARGQVRFIRDVVDAWGDAAEKASLTDVDGDPASVVGISPIPFGVELSVAIPGGLSFMTMRAAHDRLEPPLAPIGVERAVILPDPSSAGKARVLLLTDGSVLATPVEEWPRLTQLERDFVWSDIATECGLLGVNNDVAALEEVTVPVPDVCVDLTVKIPSGRTLQDVVGNTDKLVPTLSAFRVKTKAVEGRSSLAAVSVILRDVLATPLGVWPGVAAPLPLVGSRAHVGTDELGAPVMVDLVENHLLLAGVTGSGKSVSLHAVLHHYAMMTRSDGTAAVEFNVVDPKVVELKRYKPIARRYMEGSDMAEAIRMLREVKEEMLRRSALLAETGALKWTPGVQGEMEGFPLSILAIEEIADFTMSTDRAKPEFLELLREILAKGRNAGICVVATTQRPNGQAIPPVLRDQFTLRWCHRGADQSIASIVLGPEGAHCDVAGISKTLAGKGVGYLYADGDDINRVRAFFCSDDDWRQVSDRAARIPGRHVEGDASPDAPPAPAPAAAPAAAPSGPPGPPASASAQARPAAPAEAPAGASPGPSPAVSEPVRVEMPLPPVEEVMPLTVSKLKVTSRFRSRFNAELETPLKVGEILATLERLLGEHVGTVAPVAGSLNGRLVRAYPAGPMMLLVAANNRDLVDWAQDPVLDPVPDAGVQVPS